MNLKGDVFPEAGQGLKSQNFPREKRRQTAEHLEPHGECRDPQFGDSSYVLVWGGGCRQNRGSYLVCGREVIKMDIIIAESKGQTLS